MNKTILLVDDEKDILDLIRKILMDDKYHILMARGGQELFAVLNQNRPDLIVMDVMMPEMDGYEICRRLKSQPKTQNIPILMLTVLSGHEDKNHAQSMGADAYMTKPFEPAELAAKIKSML